MLTANPAVALVRAGHSTMAADLDLGGADLHTIRTLGATRGLILGADPIDVIRAQQLSKIGKLQN
jgi:hypothetical protein